MHGRALLGARVCRVHLTPEETAQASNRLRELLKANDRSPEDFEFSMSPVAAATPADLQRYRAAGLASAWAKTALHALTR